MLTVRSAVLAVLLALGVLVAPGVSGAFWNSAVPAGVEPIQTGTLELRVGDEGAVSRDYLFSALAAENMGPGSYGQASLLIANAGSSDFVYSLREWTSTNANLYDSLDLKVTRVTSPVQCPTQGVQGGTVVDVRTSQPLQAGTQDRLCLRVTLRDDAQQALVSGTDATLVFSWQAEQS